MCVLRVSTSLICPGMDMMWTSLRQTVWFNAHSLDDGVLRVFGEMKCYSAGTAAGKMIGMAVVEHHQEVTSIEETTTLPSRSVSF